MDDGLELKRVVDLVTQSDIDESVYTIIDSVSGAVKKYPLGSFICSIAPIFDGTADYNAGDYCNYNGQLYQFDSDHAAGEWTGLDVSTVNLSQILGEMGEDISDLQTEMSNLQEDVVGAVDDWLDAHPEATTTVQDGSISYVKLADNVKNYVTPEMFGAAGDGVADDTIAVQNCINAAVTAKKPVRGFNVYKTTSPLTITANILDLVIERISYTGNECGVIISGSYNTIRIGSLYCSGGKGIIMRRTSSQTCSWNKINVTRLFATGHAVDFDTNDQLILYNTFDIRYIKSDTGNCFNGATGVGENVFTNSSCSCPAGWAIYKANGRYYNFTLENDVLNGIYIDGDTLNYFSGFRVRELVDKIVYEINGQVPGVQGGTLIKYVGSKCQSKFISDDTIPYAAIDVDEMDTIEDMLDESPVNWTGLAKTAFYNVIDAPIRYGNWDTQNGFVVPAKQMIVTAGKKICIPAYETVYTITDSDYDMRDDTVWDDDAKIYPTKMVIGVDNCVIHLPNSYCAYGYSEFIVDQSHGHLCTIYDSNSTVTPIFNGASLGGGIYKLKAFCDPSVNAITENQVGSNQTLNDGSNYSWTIERIEERARLETVYVDDFGAVGDGLTDDSAAVQAAVNAGYNVYFSDGKTYYIPTTVNITQNTKLHGGRGTIIMTKLQNGLLNNVFVASGTLKKTTTLTTDYTSNGSTANSGNRFTLTDMTDINIGDLMIITATDQFYSYARPYYYLGGTLLIGDIYDGHLFTTCDLPYNIENTANVTVQIYDAPTVVFENLTFKGETDMENGGHYKYMITLSKCKNSVVRNCTLFDLDNAISLEMCNNTRIEGISMSKVKEDNARAGDGYGLNIYSCTNTVVQRVNAICGQSCIDVTGSITSLHTYIKYCELSSECRGNAIGSHENVYNTVIEDCVVTGINVLGTAYISRCRFIKNNRIVNSNGVSFCGNHDPNHSILKIRDCIFDEGKQIYISAPLVSNPVQAFDDIVGLVEITDCQGGFLIFQGTQSEYILSNVINELRLTRWKDCAYFSRSNASDDIIKKLYISDCSFKNNVWINDGYEDHGMILENIYDFDCRSTIPMMHKVSADKPTIGSKYTLPGNTSISLSSSNTSAKYVICGRNIASNDPDDYFVGNVYGSAGGDLTRTIATGTCPTISSDADGNIVFTQPGNTSSNNMYPVGLFYCQEYGTINMSATIKNTGATDGASFKPYVALVNCDTGKLVDRYLGTEVQATAAGATISFSKTVRKNYAAMCYYYCSTPVANSVTTFENMKACCDPAFAPKPLTDSDVYEAHRRTGDGSVPSLDGVNNIMCSELDFHVTFSADYVDSPIGLLPSGTGVSF